MQDVRLRKAADKPPRAITDVARMMLLEAQDTQNPRRLFPMLFLARR
jgi:hypothetical protein